MRKNQVIIGTSISVLCCVVFIISNFDQDHSSNGIEAMQIGESFLENENNMDEEQAFIQFMAKFEKAYLTKEEYQTRKKQFITTFRDIQEMNKKFEGRFQLKINQFADLSRQEFKDQYITKRQKPLTIQIQDQPESPQNTEEDIDSNYKDTMLDWRLSGAVSPVKTQNKCGAHWAMAVVDSVESTYQITNKGQVPIFSTQQLIDCLPSSGWGCYENIDILDSLQYIQTYGIQSNSDYPYIASEQRCKYDSSKIKAKIYNITQPRQSTPKDMKTHLLDGPLIAEVEGDQPVFQYYSSGIIDDTSCGYEVSHKVLIVGFGYSNGKNYWIVKNNWGSSWGESGYVRIAIMDGPGICGIQMNTMHATIAKMP